MSQIVSVRMPTTLLDTLETLAPEHHCKDLSELMRDVIRRRIRQYAAAEASDEEKAQLILELRTLLRRLQDA